MNLFPHALLLTFTMAGCVSGPSQLSELDEVTIKLEVEAAFDRLVDATVSADHDRYFSYFDQGSFSALSANGSTLSSFETFKLIYEPQLGAVQSYNVLKFDPVHIQVLDHNNAVLTNEYTAEVVLTSGEVVAASGAGAQVWSKSTGDWKLVHVSDAVKR